MGFKLLTAYISDIQHTNNDDLLSWLSNMECDAELIETLSKKTSVVIESNVKYFNYSIFGSQL